MKAWRRALAAAAMLAVGMASALAQTRQAVTAIHGVTDRLDEALTRLRLTAIGSAHPSIVDAIANLEQARSRLDDAHSLASAALSSADNYRSMV